MIIIFRSMHALRIENFARTPIAGKSAAQLHKQ